MIDFYLIANILIVAVSLIVLLLLMIGVIYFLYSPDYGILNKYFKMKREERYNIAKLKEFSYAFLYEVLDMSDNKDEMLSIIKNIYVECREKFIEYTIKAYSTTFIISLEISFDHKRQHSEYVSLFNKDVVKIFNGFPKTSLATEIINTIYEPDQKVVTLFLEMINRHRPN